MKSFQPNCDASTAIDLTMPLGSNDRRVIGDELKTMFDAITSGPMPERLLQLADALEEAFRRGDLFEPRAKLDS
jgi:hypothetical protein